MHSSPTAASGSSTSSTGPAWTTGSGSSARPPASCSCSTGTTGTARPSPGGSACRTMSSRASCRERRSSCARSLQLRVWREVALWWAERRLLLVADALGTISFFRAGDEPAGLHPLLRLRPPRSLRGLEPRPPARRPRRGRPPPRPAGALEDRSRRGDAGSRAGSWGCRGSFARARARLPLAVISTRARARTPTTHPPPSIA